MMASVRVATGLCRGTGLCEAMRPELFRLGDADHATTMKTDLDDDDQVEAAREVAECCPMEAIIVSITQTA